MSQKKYKSISFFGLPSKSNKKTDSFKYKEIDHFALKFKRLFMKKIFLLKFVFVIACIVLIYFISKLGYKVFLQLQIQFYSSLIMDFLTTPPYKILSTEGKTNILLLGKGGEGHQAPELTDTIILMSVDHFDSSIKLISLPRDIWIENPRGKINGVYEYGNRKEQGGGVYLIKSVVAEIIGEKVHYYVLIDFSGFKKLIDVVGGIDVEVVNSFTDNRFPISGRENDLCNGDKTLSCRYETISFEKGLTHMNGETALKFVRSRYAHGEEGNDLARNARQQLVVNAFVRKFLSKEILFSKDKLIEIKDTAFSVLETDISLSGLAIIARRIYDNKGISQSYVVPEELLYSPKYSLQYDNLYVFLPVSGKWDKMHKWVDSVLYNTN